jgi:hypothetical protein
MTTQSKPTTNKSTIDNDDAGEFAALNGHDQLAAFLFQKYGEAMLREVFKADGTFAREGLEDAAEELETRGLDQVAAVMRDIAAQCPSGFDIDNPFEDDRASGGHNWLEWRRMWLFKRRERTGELRKVLLRHRAQKQRQTQAKQAKASHTRH